ncbi:glycoprotein 3-alpha-L-fucosyltransferase [Profundibacterium mesophilum KAUST100406-0324]|uniref:Glycoprotein 3-alpha-L-fucosyltransferase n=1 Tax=Profundibacterium mesophilum KAUST100406-0324 TaxID=1037889 RepID=A0A921TC80_9RHOB|nr:glycoprotein 3-alpha-L-fucosyltransferase [Profundibacterium mesophilum KAUST100406-0324]
MSAPITVVIPTRDAEDALPAAATALLPAVIGGIVGRLIVSDAGSRDGTLRIARALGAEIVTGPAGRGAQIARGVAAAGEGWVLILHADTILEGDWMAAVAAHVRGAGPGGEDRAGWFALRFRAEGAAPRIVAGWANLRARWAGLPYGDQGLLVHSSLLARAGGVPQLPLMEDVALARALRGRLVRLRGTASTDARRYVEGGWTRRGARNLWTLTRYLAGADPARLAKRYERR